MSSMRVTLASVVGAATLLLAGCGGSSDPPSSTDLGTLAPKDAGAFVVVDTDQTSAQWKSLKALLAKIPGGEKAISGSLSQAGAAKGLSLQQVGAAFGKQLVVVVPTGAKQPVVLAKPDDPAKLEALLAKSKAPHVTGDEEGWTVVAVSQKALDAYKAALAKGTLAENDSYAQAVKGLPAVALVRGYVDSKRAASFGATAASSTGAASSGLTSGLVGGAGQVGTVGFAVTAAGSALRVEGSLEPKGGAALASYTPSLLDRVPADALLAVSFDGAGQAQAIQQALQGTGSQLATIEKQLGVKAADLAGALDGEGVIYLRPGLLIPEITLAVKPKDVSGTKATFDALAAKLGGSGAGTLIQGLKLTTAVVDGAVLISTSPTAASGIAASGTKLTGTDRFKTAAKEVGLGSTTSGFAFVDVHALAPLVKTALGALGSTTSSSASTDKAFDALLSFDTVAATATPDGSRMRFAAVIRVP